jgi:hypothetical protein
MPDAGTNTLFTSTYVCNHIRLADPEEKFSRKKTPGHETLAFPRTHPPLRLPLVDR